MVQWLTNDWLDDHRLLGDQLHSCLSSTPPISYVDMTGGSYIFAHKDIKTSGPFTNWEAVDYCAAS